MIYEDEYSKTKAALDKSFLFLADYFKEKSKIWADFYHLDFATFHYKIEKEVLEFFKPKNFIKQQITAIIVARDEGKSKIISVLYSIWNAFIKNKDHIVLTSSAKGAKSIDNLTDIIRLIEDSAFKHVFPWERGKWAPSQGIIEIIYKDRRILFRGIGIEGAILGATWGAERIALWIGDDLEDPEVASSKDRVDKSENFINSVILPAMSTRYVKDEKWPGQIVFVGTFHGLDCLLARINSDLWRDITKIVKFPALVPIGGKKLAKRLNVREDCSIWEEKKSTEWLHKIRANYMLRGEEDVWEMQYMCRLVASKKRSFRPEFWTEIDLKEAHEKLKKAVRLICCFDMAYTKGKASDAVGCCIAAHLPGSRIIVFRGSAEKMSPEQFYSLCLELHEEWGYKLEMFGDSNALPYIRSFFYERNIKHGVNIEIFPFRIDDSKYRAAENMINAMVPFYNTGMIEFVRDKCKDLKSQMFIWEGKKTKGEAKWDAIEAFGAHILFLAETQLKEDIEVKKPKRLDQMTAGEIADIHFEKKEKDRNLPHGLPEDWFDGY